MTTQDTSSAAEAAPAGQCPVLHQPPAAMGSLANQHWWPEQLNLRPLNKNSPKIDPMGDGFDYSAEFNSLDLAAVKTDIAEVLTTSQDWWPADYGHYGPLIIRMTWHSAGTYRIHDGRGGGGSGTHRFAPLNSWPDNANLDKARRLLWPVKQKYGRKISWADLMILAGNVALESMGFKTFGFGGGRVDVWEPEEDIYWGPETGWLDDERYSGDRELADPLGAVQMGLIYVNPEGPNGNPDPLAAARDIRETFRRMAMDDTETVALIAGGHTFGKTHGAADGDQYVGAEPEGASLEEQGLGWANTFGTGVGGDAITSGSGGGVDAHPGGVGQLLLRDPVRLRVGADQEPGGRLAVGPCRRRRGGHRARRPRPVQEPHPGDADHRPVAAHGPGLRADLAALPGEPRRVRRRLREGLVQAGAPRHGAGCAVPGSGGPRRGADLAGPGPRRRPRAGGRLRRGRAQGQDPRVGLSVSQLVAAAWASASTFRDSDMRGGANGARVRLAPQADWEANDPASLAEVLSALEGIQAGFNGAQSGGKRVSLADLIVLGGCAAVEEAARRAGVDVDVPFSPGRTDASTEQTDVESFAVLEPTADGFRNYWRAGDKRRPETVLVDRASLLSLTAPEMTVLVGGLRALGANSGGSSLGVLTDRAGTLTNDFFVNLLDMGTEWRVSETEHVYEGRDRDTGELRWTATAVDLVFGSNSQLRAIAEVYGADDASEQFVADFIAAWNKVMNLDRFDLA